MQGRDATNCFADDTNFSGKQKVASVAIVKNILLEFEKIIGLKCNIEKHV